MEAIIEFVGGPLDGKTLTSDDIPEFDPNKAAWLVKLVAASREIAERPTQPVNLLTWRVPHQLLADRALKEQWSETQKKAMMYHHDYHVTQFEVDNELAMLKAFYKGCS